MAKKNKITNGTDIGYMFKGVKVEGVKSPGNMDELISREYNKVGIRLRDDRYVLEVFSTQVNDLVKHNGRVIKSIVTFKRPKSIYRFFEVEFYSKAEWDLDRSINHCVDYENVDELLKYLGL